MRKRLFCHADLRLLCLRTKGVRREAAQFCIDLTRTGVSPKLGIPPHFTNLSRKNQIAQRVSQKIFLNDINQIQLQVDNSCPLAVCFLWIFPWFSVILSEKTRMQRKPGVFPLARYQSCRMEFPDGSESGEIIVYRHRF